MHSAYYYIYFVRISSKDKPYLEQYIRDPRITLAYSISGEYDGLLFVKDTLGYDSNLFYIGEYIISFKNSLFEKFPNLAIIFIRPIRGDIAHKMRELFNKSHIGLKYYTNIDDSSYGDMVEIAYRYNAEIADFEDKISNYGEIIRTYVVLRKFTEPA